MLLDQIKKNLWSILGVFLTILFGLSGIYYYYRDKKPEITLEILNDSNVLDVHESLKDLTVLFQGQNIQKNNLNLKMLHVRIINSGETTILQDDFDSNMEWGLNINEGKIIEARFLDDESNSTYIKENLKPVLIRSNFLKFQKVILEKKKYFSFNLLILHEKNIKVTPFLSGKIAGIENFITLNSYNNQPNHENIILKIVGGNLFVQLARVFIYFFLAFFLMIGIALVLVLFDEKKEKKQKEKRKVLIEKLFPVGTREDFNYFMDAYVEDGFGGLSAVNKNFSEPNKLYEDFSVYLLDVPTEKYIKRKIHSMVGGRPDSERIVDYYFLTGKILSELKKLNEAKMENETIVIDQKQKSFLLEMIEAIKNSGENC